MGEREMSESADLVLRVAKAICREQCAFMGEPPCWQVDGLSPDCDEPGCLALAEAAISAMLSAAPAAPNGWQPISTAPKDGTEFLGFGGGVEGDKGIQVVRWCERVGCWETPEASLEDWDNQAEGYSRPTHWMPLPDAPTEAYDCGPK